MTKYSAFIIAGCETNYKFQCQKCKIVSDVYDHATRLRSFELIASAAAIVS